jgi:hypothetical protein
VKNKKRPSRRPGFSFPEGASYATIVAILCDAACRAENTTNTSHNGDSLGAASPPSLATGQTANWFEREHSYAIRVRTFGLPNTCNLIDVTHLAGC